MDVRVDARGFMSYNPLLYLACLRMEQSEKIQTEEIASALKNVFQAFGEGNDDAVGPELELLSSEISRWVLPKIIKSLLRTMSEPNFFEIPKGMSRYEFIGNISKGFVSIRTTTAKIELVKVLDTFQSRLFPLMKEKRLRASMKPVGEAAFSRIDDIRDFVRVSTEIICEESRLRQAIDDFQKRSTDLIEYGVLSIDELSSLFDMFYHDFLDFIFRNGLKIRGRHLDKPLDLSKENIPNEDFDLVAEMSDEKREFVLPAPVLFRNLLNLKFKIDFAKSLGIIDHENIQREALASGQKGANLMQLKFLMANSFFRKYISEKHCDIPEFFVIPTSVYKKYAAGEDISSDLKQYYYQIHGPVYLRSSAVFSEDGENMTGAGIYESVPLKDGSSFEVFLEKVKLIFDSVNSEKAKNYRAENGVMSEEMAIVVQQRVPARPETQELGYMNTSMAGQPDLVEISFGDGKRFMFKKGLSIEMLLAQRKYEALKLGAAKLSIFPIDHKSINNSRLGFEWLQRLLTLALFLDVHYGKPVQIEFALEQVEERDSPYNTIHLLQTRPLPKKFAETSVVEFPDEEPLFEAMAAGTGDVVLDVLFDDNNDNELCGIRIFENSEGYSHKSKELCFPRSGAVAVLGQSRLTGGHIETLAVERGLLCVFNVQSCTVEEAKTALRSCKKVRVVMNGLISRVYKLE